MAKGSVDALLQELHGCLVGERAALARGDALQLDTQVQAKSRVLQVLQNAVREMPTLTDEARERIAQLERINQLNAALLSSRLAFNRARAEALLGAAQSALYGAGGTLQPAAAATGRSAAAA